MVLEPGVASGACKSSNYEGVTSIGCSRPLAIGLSRAAFCPGGTPRGAPQGCCRTEPGGPQDLEGTLEHASHVSGFYCDPEDEVT